MRAITTALLEPLALPAGPILELGCGAGQLLAHLQPRLPSHNFVGGDLHPLALAFARQAVPATVGLAQLNALQLPWQSNSFAAVLALDSFDQLGVDLHGALAESWRVLVDNGLLLLRVSAHPWLTSAHDAAFNTGRRFAKTELVEALQRANFQIERATYANSLLAPPVVLLRLLQRWGWLAFAENLYEESATTQLLQQALQLEAQWLRQTDLPWGISLYMLARKRG